MRHLPALYYSIVTVTAFVIVLLLLPLQGNAPPHSQAKPGSKNHQVEAPKSDKRNEAPKPSEGQSQPVNTPAKATSEEKDGQAAKSFDYATAGFWVNFVLALGTLVIAVFAVIQAVAAKDNARAAKLNAQVLMESQRPRIVAKAHGDPISTLGDPHARRVELEVINKGLMPATNYRYQSWIEVLPDTSGVFTAAADHFSFDVSSVLYPDTPQIINIPFRKGISPEDWAEVKKLRKHVCVRLYIEYTDPFVNGRRCNANFGFHVVPKGLGFLDKYNGVGYEDKKTQM